MVGWKLSILYFLFIIFFSFLHFLIAVFCPIYWIISRGNFVFFFQKMDNYNYLVVLEYIAKMGSLRERLYKLVWRDCVFSLKILKNNWRKTFGLENHQNSIADRKLGLPIPQWGRSLTASSWWTGHPMVANEGAIKWSRLSFFYIYNSVFKFSFYSIFIFF